MGWGLGGLSGLEGFGAVGLATALTASRAVMAKILEKCIVSEGWGADLFFFFVGWEERLKDWVRCEFVE